MGYKHYFTDDGALDLYFERGVVSGYQDVKFTPARDYRREELLC